LVLVELEDGYDDMDGKTDAIGWIGLNLIIEKFSSVSTITQTFFQFYLDFYLMWDLNLFYQLFQFLIFFEMEIINTLVC
jgi:hypothetical protein